MEPLKETLPYLGFSRLSCASQVMVKDLNVENLSGNKTAVVSSTTDFLANVKALVRSLSFCLPSQLYLMGSLSAISPHASRKEVPSRRHWRSRYRLEQRLLSQVGQQCACLCKTFFQDVASKTSSKKGTKVIVK